MSGKIYEENIFSLGIVIALLIPIIFILINLFYNPSSAPAGSLIFFLIFFVLILINFKNLKIEMSAEKLVVSYGFLKKNIPWKNIKIVQEDNVGWFHGYGIRFFRRKGKWYLIYNNFSSPLVSLHLKKGRIKGFVFSTQKPQEVIALIKERIS